MEDWNTVAADCFVISCCCQCLVLQIAVFILLKIPYRLFRKTLEFAKKKLRLGKWKGKGIEIEMGEYNDEFFGIHSGPLRFYAEFSMNEIGGFGSCIEEVERVYEELVQQGEFAFGSFWGKEASGSFLPTFVNDDFSAQYEFIEMVGSFSSS